MELCHLNLENANGKLNKNLKQTNTLNTNLESLFPNIARQQGFNIVVGNPPFQNLLKNKDYHEKDSIYSQVLSGIANSATLMIAKGYEFLKEGGYLGYVLPKNIIRVDSFKALRNFLITNTRIICIYDLDHYFKDVRGDQIILIFQKKILTQREIDKNIVKILIFKKGNNFLNPYSYDIPQKKFNKYNFFPIFYHKDMFPLADKLLREKNTLEKVCEGKIFRGLGISTKSDSFDNIKTEDSYIAYRGDSIKRFGIKYGLFINKNKLHSLYNGAANRLKVNKVILQNLCSKEGGIFATICGPKEITLDTVTNIVSDRVNPKYILGLLNSKIANFFLLLIIFLKSNFTIHTDRQYIGKMPVALPDKRQEDEIIKIVDDVLRIKDNYSKEFFKEYDKLNKLFFKIYKLNKTETDIINRLLLEVMSKKQNGITNE